jgi:hypothetical protein
MPLLAALSLGLLSGGMLFIRLVLVPFWQDSPPGEFRAWFAVHSHRIRRLMVPLGAASLVTTGAAALTGGGRGSADRGPRRAAAGAALAVVAITAAVNEPANRQLAQEDASDAETEALLRRWARWHDARVVLGLVGTAAAVVTLARQGE